MTSKLTPPESTYRKNETNILEPKASHAKLVQISEPHEEDDIMPGIVDTDYEPHESRLNFHMMSPDDSCLNLEFIKTLIRLKENKSEGTVNLSKFKGDFDLMSNIHEINIDDSRSSLFGLIDQFEPKKEPEKVQNNKLFLEMMERRRGQMEKMKENKKVPELREKMERIRKEQKEEGQTRRLQETKIRVANIKEVVSSKEKRVVEVKQRPSGKIVKDNLSNFKDYINSYMQRKKESIEASKKKRGVSMDVRHTVKIDLNASDKRTQVKKPQTAFIDLELLDSAEKDKKAKSQLRLVEKKSKITKSTDNLGMKEKIRKYFKK